MRPLNHKFANGVLMVVSTIALAVPQGATAQGAAPKPLTDIAPLPASRPKDSNYFFAPYKGTQFLRKARAVVRSCEYLAYTDLKVRVANLHYSTEEHGDYVDFEKNPALYADWEIATEFFGGIYRSIDDACDPRIVSQLFHAALKDCNTAEAQRKELARRRYDRLARLVQQRKRELRTALALGPGASKIPITPTDAGKSYDTPSTGELKVIIKEAEKLLAEAQAAKDPCPPDGQKPREKEEKTKKPISDDEAQSEPISNDPCPVGSTEEVCTRWEWLLGNWTSDAGGLIEFRLEGDTVSAYVVSATERMEKEGYTAGMQVIRGLRFGGQGQGIWAWHAEDGEIFEAARPDREPGEVYGNAKWTSSALVYINKDQPGTLRLPSQLEARMSSYKKWYRSGSTF